MTTKEHPQGVSAGTRWVAGVTGVTGVAGVAGAAEVAGVAARSWPLADRGFRAGIAGEGLAMVINWQVVQPNPCNPHR